MAAEKLEDLNLPNTTVLKIIKEALPDNINVGKDARNALSRAGSVFILYVTSQATREAQGAKRKVLLGQDIVEALRHLEFEEFLEPMEEMLKTMQETKRLSKSKKNESQTEEEASNDEENQ